MPPSRPALDVALVQIVDAALADATARGGEWLACRLGCTPCCHGVFAISALDALRLREGLEQLAERDPARADAVQARAAASVQALTPDFPGDPVTGILGESAHDRERFAVFADQEPCPALDPATGACDLYAARPLTCRIFGPPVMQEGGLGACELCFVGADEQTVAAAEMHLAHEQLEAALDATLEREGGLAGSTLVAFALAGSPSEAAGTPDT